MSYLIFFIILKVFNIKVEKKLDTYIIILIKLEETLIRYNWVNFIFLKI